MTIKDFGFALLAFGAFLLVAVIDLAPFVCIGFAIARWHAGLHEDAVYYLLMAIALSTTLRHMPRLKK